jgi:hypothetical protein
MARSYLVATKALISTVRGTIGGWPVVLIMAGYTKAGGRDMKVP